LTCADGLNTTTVFFQLCTSLATIANLDIQSAGFILGFATIVVVLIGLVFLLGQQLGTMGVLVAIGAPIVFVIVIGWWPQWAAVFILALIVFAIAFRDQGGGG